MKKFFAILMLAAMSTAAFAQDEAPVLTEGQKAKNAGNEAYNQKDYVTAIANYEKYLSSGEEGVADDLYTLNLYEMSFYYAGNTFLRAKDYNRAYEYFTKFQNLGRSDTPTDCRFMYNYANTANKLDKDAEALALYQKCIDIDCNKDACYFAIAQIHRAAGREDEMMKVVSYGLDSLGQVGNRYYSKMLLLYQTNELKDATEVLKKAQGYAQKASGADIATYLTNMTQACKLYEEVIPMYEDVLKYPGVDDKTNANVSKAKSSIEVCKSSIEAFESYRKTIKK